jgi:hypothetical protein
MKSIRSIILLLSASVCLSSAAPEPPTEATIATACKVPVSAVTRTIRLPDDDPKHKEKITWAASYTFSQPVEFGISIVCLPHGGFKDDMFTALASRPEFKYQKVVLPDGSVIHHSLADPGDPTNIHSTTLVSKDGLFDYVLMVGIKPGVKIEDVPVEIRSSGIELIQKLIAKK